MPCTPSRASPRPCTLVPPDAVIPPDVVAMGVPAREKRPLTEGAKVWVHSNPSIYAELARRHAAGTAQVTTPAAGHP